MKALTTSPLLLLQLTQVMATMFFPYQHVHKPASVLLLFPLPRMFSLHIPTVSLTISPLLQVHPMKVASCKWLTM